MKRIAGLALAVATFGSDSWDPVAIDDRHDDTPFPGITAATPTQAQYSYSPITFTAGNGATAA